MASTQATFAIPSAKQDPNPKKSKIFVPRAAMVDMPSPNRVFVRGLDRTQRYQPVARKQST
jgi:hypothetical protein